MKIDTRQRGVDKLQQDTRSSIRSRANAVQQRANPSLPRYASPAQEEARRVWVTEHAEVGGWLRDVSRDDLSRRGSRTRLEVPTYPAVTG